MENYSYTSYPESGDSSPRSREIEFDNPPPWEEQPPSNYKVKFMCSYGGKIHPRPHDNQLSYVGGETKILAVDRNSKFSSFISKLSALCDGGGDICFKYQLPGEDLDALISVTNDEDLEHMMHEYDRLYRASAKPARLRLFMFPANSSTTASFGSGEAKSDRDRFVEALNSAPIQSVESSSSPQAAAPPKNMDFLFGLDKGVPPPPIVKTQDPNPDKLVPLEVPVDSGGEDRFYGSDPVLAPAEIQRHIQDLQRLQISNQEQAMYRGRSDDNLTGTYTGDYYVPKVPEKSVPAPVAVTAQPSVSPPPAYWPEKHMTGGAYPTAVTTNQAVDSSVYMFSTPAGVYHAPMMRQMAPQAGQGYFAVQRMPAEVYREQQIYGHPQPPPQHQQNFPAKMQPGYPEGIGMARPSGGGGVAVGDTGYTQMAYDNAGRQVYYTTTSGVMPQYQPVAAIGTDVRPGVGPLNQEGKVVTKVSQTPV